MNLGLRARLLSTVIGAILVFFIIMMAAVRTTLSHDLQNLATSQVSAGADAFAASINSRADQTRAVLSQAAAQQNLIAAVSRHDSAAVKEIVQGLEQPNGLSWITVSDPSGKVIARANGLDSGSARQPMVASALRNRIVAGIITLDTQFLSDEFLTDDAAPLKSAVAIAAAVPIGRDGRVVGVVYGGNVLGGVSRLVDGVAKFTGGSVQVLLGDRVAASTLTKPDGSRALDVAVPNAAPVRQKQKYVGTDISGGTRYFAQITPLMDYRGRAIGGLWYGIPLAQMSIIQTHATSSILLYGLLGLLVAIAIAVFVVNRVSGAIVQSSQRVSTSARALDVLVVGSEVSNDHVMQTREKLETVEELLERLGPTLVNGDGTRLRTLAKEATGDIIVIDTLTTELNQRMRGAVDRVAELNDVVERLNRLVNGSRN